jgi:hypothetical protein
VIHAFILGIEKSFGYWFRYSKDLTSSVFYYK